MILVFLNERGFVLNVSLNKHLERNMHAIKEMCIKIRWEEIIVSNLRNKKDQPSNLHFVYHQVIAMRSVLQR